MTLIPQYATSIDPAVIAAIEKNLTGRQNFHQLAMAFSGQYGTDPKRGYIPSHFAGRWELLGIVGDKPVDGQWARAARGRAWRPAKRNPVFAEMSAISHTNAAVPGLSAAYDGPHLSDGRQHILYPQVFVADGAAWFHLSEQALEKQSGMWGEGNFDADLWTEVLGSAWHAAREHLGAASSV